MKRVRLLREFCGENLMTYAISLCLVVALAGEPWRPHSPRAKARFASEKLLPQGDLVGFAWLESPGGNLHFGVELTDAATPGKREVTIINGRERILLPVEIGPWVTRQPQNPGQDGDIIIRIDHYDSQLSGRFWQEIPLGFTGEWRKRRGTVEWTKLPFHMAFAERSVWDMRDLPPLAPEKIAGKWSVKFATDETPAVGVFRREPDDTLSGTFLTTSGDYRYLSGEYDGNQLVLSAFDGAHAFLFTAKLMADGTLSGDFWSGDKHHETWTARRDENASLPDGFALVKVNEGVKLSDISFPDVDGKLRSLSEPTLGGNARIIQVFGTWCPNCHDEAAFLAELHTKYGGRGLSIVGLAFEATGDAKRDAEQVRRYAARHQIKYPLLVAGTRDKEKAAKAFPLLDKIIAFPTTIFLHADGRVRAVHTGYSGPATGESHEQLKSKFVEIVEELLNER